MYSLFSHPKLQKEVHQAPSTTSQAVSPPSGASLPGNVGGAAFSGSDPCGPDGPSEGTLWSPGVSLRVLESAMDSDEPGGWRCDML